MKNTYNKIISFFYNIFYFRKIRKINGFNRQIKKAVSDQYVDGIILKGKIKKEMRKLLKLDANSDFIPFDYKNRAEVKLIVEANYGNEMKRLNIKITDDLKLI